MNYDHVLKRPLTIDEICERNRDPRSQTEIAAAQQRENDIAVCKGAAEHLNRIRTFHSHNPLAVRKAERDFADACRPFGGEEGARAAGVLP